MDKAPRVSLIIPMYMCEEFAEGLLNELCGQDFRDIEIICVVDGSEDRTLEVAENYAAKDPRIRVFSQEHKGAGAARNLGITKARGEYLMFPDADDDYAGNYVSRLYHAVHDNHADMAICQYESRDHYTGQITRFAGYSCLMLPKNKPLAPLSVKHFIKAVSNVPHNKIFRTELISSGKLSFSETASLNDMFFSTATVICSRSVVLVEDHLLTYNFKKNPDSISVNRGCYPDDCITVYRELYDWLTENGLMHSLRDDYCAKWGADIRGYARVCSSPEFPEDIARALSQEKPWAGMADDELQRRSLLYSGVPECKMRKIRKKLSAGKLPADETRSLEWQYSFAAAEVRNYSEIKRILREKYGRDMHARDTYLTARLEQARQAGFSMAVQLVCRKLLNRAG